jgi:type I restriction enzyme R subunit
VVGVIEAKPAGTPLSGVEWQSARYAEGLPERHRKRAVLVDGRLPFVLEASGSETHLTNGLDPEPRARRIANVPRTETLARWLRDATTDPAARTWRAKVRTLPALDTANLRPAQVDAITAIERSLAQGRYSRSLVQMATGSGKTYTAVTEAYRLLKYGGFSRVLFLVDRNNLGRQTLREFQAYVTPDDGRKFTELYPVDRLTGAVMLASSAVVISTIQRLYGVLRGRDVPDTDDPALDAYTPERPVEVDYSAAVPPETFDLVIVDECHRSIYGNWRGVIEYFDAHVVGLTATPVKQTFGFFQQNLVSEYTFEEAVADQVNVDFDVYRIETQISAQGSAVDAGATVPVRDRRTRIERYQTLDEELLYAAPALDRSVTARHQIRLVLETFRDRLFTEIFPGRSVVPKTLIFCKDDNHAEEVVTTVRDVFGKGNDFAAKITYRAGNAEELLQTFRTSPTLRIAVTVDMIATGTDVKPLECLLFLRDVRSPSYFEQMKGRGARTLSEDDFQVVTPDAPAKTRFVLVDAVGVTEHEFVAASPLNRKRSESLAKLLGKIADLTMTEDDVATLASRLARLDRELDDDERDDLAAAAGMSLAAVTRRLVEAVDPDVQAAALADAGPDADREQVVADLLEQAVEPLAANPDFRALLVEIRRSHDILIDESSRDVLLRAEGAIDPDRARVVVTSWRQYMDDHEDEIAALQVLYAQPRGRVSYDDLSSLSGRIRRPPYNWTPELLWEAYEALDQSKVRRAPRHAVTDLIRIVRYELNRDDELVPYETVVTDRFTNWMARQRQAGVTFTADQMWWLEGIRDVVVQSAGVSANDLAAVPFTERGGVDGAIAAFGDRIGPLLEELDQELPA